MIAIVIALRWNREIFGVETQHITKLGSGSCVWEGVGGVLGAGIEIIFVEFLHKFSVLVSGCADKKIVDGVSDEWNWCSRNISSFIMSSFLQVFHYLTDSLMFWSVERERSFM